MKNKLFILALFILISLFNNQTSYCQTGNIGIGTTAPDSSAILDIQSTSKGVLIPRMNTAQVSSILNPEKGLMVFDTTKNSFVYYNGIKWKKINITELNDLTDVKTDYANFNTIAGTGGANILSSASDNTSFGHLSLNVLTSGSRNNAFGRSALHQDTSGHRNNAFGTHALAENRNGSNNVAFGESALFSNTSGDYNIGIGTDANHFNKTGSNNTMLGYQSGRGTILPNNISGSIFIGYQSGFNETTDDKLYIENSDSATPLIYGDFANDSIKVYGTLSIKDEYSFPSNDGVFGQVMANDGNGQLVWSSLSNVNELNDLADVNTDTLKFNMIAGNGGANILPTANYNTGFGNRALRDLTSGYRNNAFGALAFKPASTPIKMEEPSFVPSSSLLASVRSLIFVTLLVVCHDVTPEPFVVNTCPELPSIIGRTNASFIPKVPYILTVSFSKSPQINGVVLSEFSIYNLLLEVSWYPAWYPIDTDPLLLVLKTP